MCWGVHILFLKYAHIQGGLSLVCIFWFCICFHYILFCANPVLSSIHRKGGDVRAYFSLSGFSDWWQLLCGLILCPEHFRIFSSRHKMTRRPSEVLEDRFSSTFLFLVWVIGKSSYQEWFRVGKVCVESSRTHLTPTHILASMEHHCVAFRNEWGTIEEGVWR